MEPCHWSEGRHNYVGVSLQERLATMQVMLGVSLRARWDAILVTLNDFGYDSRKKNNFVKIKNKYSSLNLDQEHRALLQCNKINL